MLQKVSELRAQRSLHLTPKEVQSLMALFPQGLVAIDVETTGLSALTDKIIELAAVKLNPDGSEETFHTLVNPLVTISQANSNIHGLTNLDLQEAQSLKKPLRYFWDFCGTKPLLAHNALFDIAFLVKGSYDMGLETPLQRTYDSCRLARSWFKQPSLESHLPKPANFKLSTLADFFDLNMKAHQALDDALAALKMCARLLALIPAERHAEFRERAFSQALSQFKSTQSFILPRHLQDLPPFLANHTPLLIRYTGGTHDLEWRPVKPIALLPMPKGPVLYGICQLSHLNKSFVLKRIKEFKVNPHPPTPQASSQSAQDQTIVMADIEVIQE
jgi:DNA polymerase-3 subunit epsilon